MIYDKNNCQIKLNFTRIVFLFINSKVKKMGKHSTERTGAETVRIKIIFQ